MAFIKKLFVRFCFAFGYFATRHASFYRNKKFVSMKRKNYREAKTYSVQLAKYYNTEY